MSALAAFAAGLVFGLGLLLSGMADPGKVKGFLDVAGRWDPSLAFVMAGAIAVTLPAFRLAARRGRPLLERAFDLPTARDVTAPLVAGSAAFGIGWGLAGFCPGPAIVALGAGYGAALAFVPAMLAGMAAHRLLSRAATDVSHESR